MNGRVAKLTRKMATEAPKNVEYTRHTPPHWDKIDRRRPGYWQRLWRSASAKQRARLRVQWGLLRNCWGFGVPA